MNKKEFNKYLNACTKYNRLDVDKIKALPTDVRTAMALHIIRNRGPVLEEFITPDIDESWLVSCGYMYRTKGRTSGYTFIHTCEHTIR